MIMALKEWATAWLLEGWHFPVEFLIDSGSSITAISNKLFCQLLISKAHIRHLCGTDKTIKGANGRSLRCVACPCVTFPSWVCV